MAPTRSILDRPQLQNAQESLDSGSHLFNDPSELGSQPPAQDASAFIEPGRFDEFNFTFSPLPDPSALSTLPGPSSSRDAFTQQASLGLETPQSLSTMPAAASGGPSLNSDHRSQSMEESDVVQDKISPAANSLDDSVADEFGISSHGRADGTDLGGKAKDDKADAPPAWSELKTKAGKERKRLPLACIACRRKKIRCSGEKPSCNHCLRSRIPCVYKVTARKAAPRTDYMAMLDKRLKRMEERIIKVIPKPDQETTASVTRAVVKPAIPGTFTANKSASKKRGADEAFGHDLEVWAKAPAKPKPATENHNNSLQLQEAEENKLLSEGSEALPSWEIQEHLAEVFFDNVYGQSYHLLHKPSYMRKLKNNTLPPVLILSVCAVAARFTENPRLNSSSTPQFLRGEEWASHAREICTRRYEWPNLTILTCLLILGLHEFGTCQGGRSWALGGQAIRMAYALQLHKDLDYDPLDRSEKKAPLSFIDREIRRRLMWACFLMDRFNSSGTDRPMFVREETIQIPLPIEERYFQLDMPAPTETLDYKVRHPASPDDGQLADARDNMGLSAYTIRAIAVWGRVVAYLNQGGRDADEQPMWSKDSHFAKLVKDAEGLFTSLPTHLRYSPENIEVQRTGNNASQLLFMHISMHQNMLFLNRAVMGLSSLPSASNVPSEFISEASRKTFDAANQISSILRQAEQSRVFISAPFAGYCAFSSTTIHIMGIVSRNSAIKPIAENNLTTNVKYLQRMKKCWGMFHWMVEEVRTQYRKALDSARTGPNSSKHTAPSSILQYGDWFNRYPHGLSDAEFMDPMTHRKRDKGADGVMEAKSELQSAEEFFSKISPSQFSESRDGGTRPGPNKRKSVSKKQNGSAVPAGQSQREAVATQDTASQSAANQQRRSSVQQQRRFSNTIGGQNNGPAAFSPPAGTQSQHTAFTHAISPISPSNMAGLPHPDQIPTFFPTDLLPFNLLSPGSGALQQPLERQLMLGGYPVDTGGGLATGQNMFDGIDWNSITATNQMNRGAPSRRASMKDNMSGQAHGQGTNTLPGQDNSSAWFMPFKMEPAEAPQELGMGMGMGMGNVDPFAGLFGGGGSGLTTPNQMGGLQNGP